MINRILATLPLWVALSVLTACNSYVVPGGPAPLSALGVTPETKHALSDSAVRDALAKKPLVSFPAALAVARVQAADYASYTYDRPANAAFGSYAVITVRDIEKDEDFDALAKLPQVSGVVTMKRILLDRELKSDLELRAAAARLHADLLLFYTFDTEFHTDTTIPALGILTLGIFPNKMAQVTSTASAVLMDVNNGYIYAVVESTSKGHQLANAWTSGQAVDQVRQRAEREAFEDLLAQFKKEWPNVLTTYAPKRTAIRP